ncbi:MAG: EamA family transporter [Cyanobacteria bacterium P01_A01_bin.135]
MALPDQNGEQQGDRRPTGPASSEEAASQQAHRDLQTHQQALVAQLTGVVAQLTADIDRLEQEKTDLLESTHELRSEQQDLQDQQRTLLQQQQQQWAKQLAQALANRLYGLLVQKLNAGAAEDTALGLSQATAASPAIGQLQQELGHYEEAMAQRLSRMAQMEERGEALLEALVTRIEAQTAASFQLDGSTGSPASVEKADPALTQSLIQRLAAAQGRSPSSFNLSGINMSPPPAPSQRPPTAKPIGERIASLNASLPQTGLICILLSTLALSLHNVAVGVIGVPSSLFNVWELGGFIELKSLDSSLLILWLRMIFVTPLMAVVGGVLYPATWRDLRAFSTSRDRKLLRNVCGSGAFLFISQVLIYIAIGQIGPGIAVTILFMYPIITVPLAWLLFGDRPTPLRIGVMVAILLGVVLAALPSLSLAGGLSLVGVSAAVLAGVAFAFYLISMQLSFRRLHPVPVSVIQFFTIFLLTSLILLFRPVEIVPFSPGGMIVGGFVLGTLTLLGYLFNNFGVRLMGAARASIIASSGPVLTALLAFIITPGPNTVLKGVQVLGILIVTLGITALALERLLAQQAKRKQQAAS